MGKIIANYISDKILVYRLHKTTYNSIIKNNQFNGSIKNGETT